MKPALLFAILCISLLGKAQSNDTLIPVHDPVMIKQDSVYYLFCTGKGISVWASTDRLHWKKQNPVFDSLPWGVKAVPGFVNHIWAPDISYHNGLYYLYYSVSAFGKNTSCIGVATNPTLHANDANYHWTDHGKVVESIPGRDLWNAIDPNLSVDDKGQPWLVFGSFWNGIKLVKLDSSRLQLSQPQQWYSVASRKRECVADTAAGNGAIEAPFIYKKNGYYYLFVSFDFCCRGEKSTYKMMVGRSAQITGPYLDKNNTPMLQGGGTLVLQGNAQWHGVGHNAVCNWDGKDYLIFHGYDAADKGRSKLRIAPLSWDVDGWPVAENPSTRQ
ncbi:arabinan endo-1,5-alpha-L-arabinosidase [Filimonas lacunae]|uniref:Arabinan endo-1,5-alpha-L-arabinosidase n=1 Tax=Filimonas lacunae TaxID=477680 RepID=A0A173MMI7_9BACT|nr:arabinan endo-1,5-alpha-L-arabinosidase [Filimonas lacunae]BAV08697.1 arabinan endo-1,5-alpha-L-arabinosidase [Filimonas lacunae]SIS60168.1 arabinan endo-1,5-alpha-L-arabinosidase [Filimonas lacunae]